MLYKFNYSFLKRWMEENKSISMSMILQAIGSTSNNSSLRLWEKGKSLIPLGTLLRFCNAFQVPISAFICDTEAKPEDPAPYVFPEESDQWEPDGGYVTARNPGNRAPLDPADVSFIPSRVPGYEKSYTETEDEYSIEAPETDTESKVHDNETTYASKENKDKGNFVPKEIDILALIKLEEKHHEQRAEMLSIIERQRKQIAYLTEKLIDERKTKVYRVQPDTCGADIAAEPDMDK